MSEVIEENEWLPLIQKARKLETLRLAISTATPDTFDRDEIGSFITMYQTLADECKQLAQRDDRQVFRRMYRHDGSDFRTPISNGQMLQLDLDQGIDPTDLAYHQHMILGAHWKILGWLEATKYYVDKVLEATIFKIQDLLNDEGRSALQQTFAPASVDQIEYFIPDDLPPVLAHVGTIRQIIFNLISNTRDHSGQNKFDVRQKITTTMTDGGICLFTHDNGTGIDQTMMDCIYEPDSTIRSGEGGFGLALAPERLAVNNCSIQHENENGAKFTITLPLAG